MRGTSAWIATAAALIVLPAVVGVQLVPDRFDRGMRIVFADTVADTIDLFKSEGFDPEAANRSGELRLPPVFLAELPADLAHTDTPDRRKAVFVSVVLPHVLRANERLRAERARLEALREAVRAERKIRRRDQRWLETMAARYRTKPLDFETLLRRVDVIPPRLAVAQAAQESGWGTSRFARVGNALFGQHAPIGDGTITAASAPGVGLRAFESLHDSVLGYMRNLNTHAAYKRFRFARERMRATGEPLDAQQLVATLAGYSEEGQLYITRLRTVMAQPEVAAARGARLVEEN